MSYSSAKRITYTLGSITTTSGAATLAMRGPKGKSGRLVDVIARCTTTHVLGSTPTELQIGKSGALTAYGDFFPAAMTAPTASTLTDLPGASVLGTTVIPPDTVVLATTVANATGSPAGVITYDVVIDWF